MMVRVLVDAREFANMVAHAARVLERDNPYVALDSADDGLAISAAGDSQWSHGRVDATVLEAGSAVVSGLWLNALANAMPSGEIGVETDGGYLTLRGGEASLRMRVGEEKDRPAEPAAPERMVPVDADAYAALCGSVAPEAGGTRDQPVLASVRFVAAGGLLTATATNRYMAGRRSIPVGGMPDGEWLADADWVKRNAKGVNAIGFTDRMMVVDTGGFTDAIVLTAGQYPMVDRLFDKPEEPAGVAVVDRRALMDAARMLKSVCFDSRMGIIPLILDERDGMLRVRYAGDGQDADSQGVRLLEADITGDVNVKLNADYLLTVLAGMDADRVSVVKTREMKPVLFEQDDSAVEQLVMPVR